MIAKIIIKRRFKEGNARQILALLNQLRSKAMEQAGYISGETLSKIGYPNNMVIIATWRSMEDWHVWRDSETRKRFDAMLEIYQERPADYEEFLLGTPLSASE